MCVCVLCSTLILSSIPHLSSPELISVMLSNGNKLSRNLWEAKKPKSRPLHNATRYTGRYVV